jgi:hypothetical protein
VYQIGTFLSLGEVGEGEICVSCGVGDEKERMCEKYIFFWSFASLDIVCVLYVCV